MRQTRAAAEVDAAVDEVLSDVPVRQWVLSLPYRIRYLLAYDPRLLCAVRRIFVRSVQRSLGREGLRQGRTDARESSMVFARRFESALNLNPHFHALVLDGTYG